MFVNIENAPVFVEPGAAAAFGFSELVLSLRNGRSHERHGRSVAFVDNDNDALPVQPVPVVEVDRFGRFAFREDEYPFLGCAY